jgi:hypothetical protein
VKLALSRETVSKKQRRFALQRAHRIHGQTKRLARAFLRKRHISDDKQAERAEGEPLIEGLASARNLNEALLLLGG